MLNKLTAFCNFAGDLKFTDMKELDWANLSFGYMKTNWNLRIWFKDGKWGEIEESDSSMYLCISPPPACTTVRRLLRA